MCVLAGCVREGGREEGRDRYVLLWACIACVDCVKGAGGPGGTWACGMHVGAGQVGGRRSGAGTGRAGQCVWDSGSGCCVSGVRDGGVLEQGGGGKAWWRGVGGQQVCQWGVYTRPPPSPPAPGSSCVPCIGGSARCVVVRCVFGGVCWYWDPVWVCGAPCGGWCVWVLCDWTVDWTGPDMDWDRA